MLALDPRPRSRRRGCPSNSNPRPVTKTARGCDTCSREQPTSPSRSSRHTRAFARCHETPSRSARASGVTNRNRPIHANAATSRRASSTSHEHRPTASVETGSASSTNPITIQLRLRETFPRTTHVPAGCRSLPPLRICGRSGPDHPIAQLNFVHGGSGWSGTRRRPDRQQPRDRAAAGPARLLNVLLNAASRPLARL